MGQSASRSQQEHNHDLPRPRHNPMRRIVRRSRPLSTSFESRPDIASTSLPRRRLHSTLRRHSENISTLLGTAPTSPLHEPNLSTGHVDSPPSTPLTSTRRSRLSQTITNNIPSLFSRYSTFNSRDSDPATSHESRRATEISSNRYALGRAMGEGRRREEERLEHNMNESVLDDPGPPRLEVPVIDHIPLDVSSVLQSQPSSPSSQPEAEGRIARTSRPTPSITDRLSAMTPDHPHRGLRGLGASLRRRRTRGNGPQEDQTALISRVLHFAASATAASLLNQESTSEGSPPQWRNSAPPGGALDSDEGNFGSFLQALSSGSLETALGTGVRSSTAEGAENEEQAGPLDFFRMFRLGSPRVPQSRSTPAPGNTRPSSVRSDVQGNSSQPAAEADDGNEREEGRMVPVLIVGIRALQDDNNEGADAGENMMPAFLDALRELPGGFSVGGANDTGSEGRLRRPRNPLRFGNGRHRRNTWHWGSGSSSFSGSGSADTTLVPELARPRRNSDEAVNDSTGATASSSESPTGPYPPPTTPSSPPTSNQTSGTTTPTNRLSSSSRREALLRRMTGNTQLEPTTEEPEHQARHTRHRSTNSLDHPRFGSGSSRRNGVLMEPGDGPGEGHRSWIIYILGGSYPENHPILSTPSLFTDSPTYEDMMLLSTLIGPAKPPVARADDVEAAGGLFRLVIETGVTTAHEINGPTSFGIDATERCHVCLADYQNEEEVRRLAKCSHFFHSECVDQWLTTGRNSCPLCRGEGVNEQAASEPARQSEATGDTAEAVW